MSRRKIEWLLFISFRYVSNLASCHFGKLEFEFLHISNSHDNWIINHICKSNSISNAVLEFDLGCIRTYQRESSL